MIARPWHAGERALQQRVGSAARLAEIGPQVVRDAMPLQHREFFESLPFVVAATVDAAGRPWASMLVGRAGFMRSPDAQTLIVGAWPLAGDPLAEGLAPDAPIALLGIEPATRRRNRMNGRIAAVDASAIRVEVGQSFGNCPKYIQARAPLFVREPRPETPVVETATALDRDAGSLVGAADTLFVATHAPGNDAAQAMDVSHRGGRPGFVKLEDERTLLVPDFAGNRFYMTLGNLLANPRAGLLFVDFARGDLLQLTGRAEIVERDGTALAALAGAERGWRFHVDTVVRRRDALPLRWSAAEASPHLAHTGRWAREEGAQASAG